MAGDKEGQDDIARWEDTSFEVEGERMLWREGGSGRNDRREGMRARLPERRNIPSWGSRSQSRD